MIYKNEEYVLEISENMFIYAWYNCRFQYRKKYINWSINKQSFPICIFNDLNQCLNNSINMPYKRFCKLRIIYILVLVTEWFEM